MIERLIDADRNDSGFEGLKSKLRALSKYLRVEAAKGNLHLPHMITDDTFKMIIREPAPLRPLLPGKILKFYFFELF